MILLSQIRPPNLLPHGPTGTIVRPFLLKWESHPLPRFVSFNLLHDGDTHQR
jgi:hypothetical protein